jgi:hypothetical protein
LKASLNEPSIIREEGMLEEEIIKRNAPLRSKEH